MYLNHILPLATAYRHWEDLVEGIRRTLPREEWHKQEDDAEGEAVGQIHRSE
jgi:hypothetical protein